MKVFLNPIKILLSKIGGKTRLVILTVTLSSLLEFKTRSNKLEFEKSYEEVRDTTRPGNKSFGMNFGFKTDLNIEEMLDSGDLLFMEHICIKTFSLKEMFYCYAQKLHRGIKSATGTQVSSWDNSGVLIRDKRGPRVMFPMLNKVYDLEYEEVLRLPFFNDVAVRRLISQSPEVGSVGNEFRASVHNEIYERQKASYFPLIITQADIIFKYWEKTGLLDHGAKLTECKLEEIDTNFPKFVNEKIARYSEPIILRTFMSKLEVDKY